MPEFSDSIYFVTKVSHCWQRIWVQNYLLHVSLHPPSSLLWWWFMWIWLTSHWGGWRAPITDSQGSVSRDIAMLLLLFCEPVLSSCLTSMFCGPAFSMEDQRGDKCSKSAESSQRKYPQQKEAQACWVLPSSKGNPSQAQSSSCFLASLCRCSGKSSTENKSGNQLARGTTVGPMRSCTCTCFVLRKRLGASLEA